MRERRTPSFWTRKTTTWTVLAVMALLPLPSIADYMQRYIVRNGVITAYRYEVLAPIDGVVGNLTATPGSVQGDEPALRLGNKRRTGQYRTLERELAALEDQLAQNERILSGCIPRLERDLKSSLDILKTRLTGEVAAMNEVKTGRERISRLVKNSVSPQEELDQVEAEYIKGEARVSATRLEMTQLELRRDLLRMGVIPQDLSDAALQTQSQINALKLNILACKRRMSEAETELAGEPLATGPEALLNSRFAKATVLLPESAVVWEVDVQNGMEVTKGERLLSYIDRSRLMVEVALDDATLELIQPGHPVRVRLFGRPGFMNGTASRVMGSAGIWNSRLLAAEVKNRTSRDGTVLVRIHDQDLHAEVEKFCGVGRTAYVEFEGIGLMELYLGAFLR